MRSVAISPARRRRRLWRRPNGLPVEGVRRRAPTSLPGSPAEEPSRDQERARSSPEERVESRSVLRIVLGVAGLAAVAFAFLAIAGAGRSRRDGVLLHRPLRRLVREEQPALDAPGAGLLAWSAGFLTGASAMRTPTASPSVAVGRPGAQPLPHCLRGDGDARAPPAAVRQLLRPARRRRSCTGDGLIGVLLLAVRGARLGFTWLLILAGALVFAGTDTISLWQSVTGSYTPGGALDIGWMVGILLIGLPAWRPIEARRVVDQGRHSVVLPAALGAVQPRRADGRPLRPPPVAAILAASLSLAVILKRFVVTFALSRRLHRGSEREALTDTVTTLANRRALMLTSRPRSPRPRTCWRSSTSTASALQQLPPGRDPCSSASQRRDVAAEHSARAYPWAATSSASSGPRSPGPAPSGSSRGATRP